jgi:histidine triad (HIT) family protein
MQNCLFCKIVEGKIPAKFVYSDDKLIVFHDILPQAPIHVLIVPKKHIPTILDLQNDDFDIIKHIYKIINNKLTASLGIDEKGFRIVTNCKEYGGQEVYHLHFHVLGGRKLNWPPG